MLTNAIFHITGAIIDRGYVPGLATAILIYLPYSPWVAREMLREHVVAPGLLTAAVVPCGIPMRCTDIGSCSSAAACSRRRGAP